jgi:hypothetical protein
MGGGQPHLTSHEMPGCHPEGVIEAVPEPAADTTSPARPAATDEQIDRA